MKILQIIPAQAGWNVVYPAGACKRTPAQDEAAGVVFVPVACWALVETSGGNRVLPMTGGEAGAALVPQDVESCEAVGVSPPGRRPRDWLGQLRRAKGDSPRPASSLPRPNGKPAPAAPVRPTPQPKPKPKPKPKPEPEPKLEPKPAPAPTPIKVDDPEPVDTSPVISMNDVMDTPYSVSPEAAPAKYDDIPAGDDLDLDF